jgi:ankyrin repeat protein
MPMLMDKRSALALLQELIAAHPQLLPTAVRDLSAGGALPLHLAAAGGCVDVVQVLLAAGAPVEAKDGKGLTALQVSHMHMHLCAFLGGPLSEPMH